MDSQEISRTPIEIFPLILYAFIPFALGFAVFGPGLTDVLLRIALGLVWFIGSLVACCSFAISLVIRSNSPYTKRKLVSILVGYGCVALWLFLTNPTQERITGMMKNNVPVGSSRAQVKDFLDDRKIFNEETDNGLRAVMSDGIINVGESGFDIYFYFDKNKKMSEFEVQHWVLED